MGTTDNYNTEYTERLHIDIAKEAYRATNFKDELVQMTKWLERREKLYRHAQYLDWKLSGSPAAPSIIYDVAPGVTFDRTLSIPKTPTHKLVSISQLDELYGARFFDEALCRWIVGIQNPELTQRQLEWRASYYSLAFSGVPVFHHVKFTIPDIYNPQASDSRIIADHIHVVPPHLTSKNELVPGQFDVVLVAVKPDAGETGIKGEICFFSNDSCCTL